MNRIFVYGTLKKGHGNWHYILKNHSLFMGEHTTEPVFTMIDLGAFPGVLADGDTRIKGEVFEIDDETMRRVDSLEGYPEFYNRQQIETQFGPAWMYYLGDSYRGYRQVENGEW